MLIRISVICLLASASSALAQTGVSNQRDTYGNLVRDGSTYSSRGVNQGPVNNGPIRSTPAQPSTSNLGKAQAVSK
jgi:hypothetical protein